MGRVLAADDIGSNTVHLLIAETDGKTLQRLTNVSEWVSLGENVARMGFINETMSQSLIESLKNFRKMARSKGADYLYVFATEAMREAENHEALLERISVETGLAVDLISPRREAELSLTGVLLDSPKKLDLLIEVGGGSVQVGQACEGKLEESASLLLGTGRLIADARLKSPCPPASYKHAEQIIRERLDELSVLHAQRPKFTVASGGVARGIWRALHPDGEPLLHRQELSYMAWASSYLTTRRISARFGVKDKRAATLLPGALVYGRLMDRLEITDLHVSMYGVREGAILEIARGAVQGCLV